jgi:hypothetical protein
MQLPQKHWRYKELYCEPVRTAGQRTTGIPRALLDGMEVSLVAWPSIHALKVGRELAS